MAWRAGDVKGIGFLIVMGGPQDLAVTVEECPHFGSRREQTVIARAVHVGICLGSQLIGETPGAPFDHSPEKEICKFPITLTESGRNHAMFSHFGQGLDVGHWHNDMPGLTSDAEIIAYSEGCPRQIVAYSDLVYGFQCHMELTSEVVEGLIAHSENDLSRAAEYRFVNTPEVLRAHDYNEMNEALFTFLDKLQVGYHSSTRKIWFWHDVALPHVMKKRAWLSVLNKSMTSHTLIH